MNLPVNRPALLILFFGAIALQAADDPVATCRARLRTLGGAIKAYQLLHDDKLPTKLADLYLEGLADSLADFTCPSSGTTITAPSEIEAKSDFVLGTGNMLVREKNARHEGKALAAFADGSIKPIDAPAIAKETETIVPPAKPDRPETKPKVTTNPVVPPPDQPVTPPLNEQIKIAGDFDDLLGLKFAYRADGRLVVSEVAEDSIAKDIGFGVGDLVTQLNERPVPKGMGPVTPVQLAKMAGLALGESLLLTIRQTASGEESTIEIPTTPPEVQLIPPGTVITPQRPAPPPPALGPRQPGYLGADLDPSAADARILRVLPGSPAATSGLLAADTIVAVESEPIESRAQLTERLRAATPGTTLNFLVLRAGKPKKVTVELGTPPAIRK